MPSQEPEKIHFSDAEPASISDSDALLELSKILNASLDLQFILGNILLTSMGKLMIGKAAVLLQKEEFQFEAAVMKGVFSEAFAPSYEMTARWEGFQQLDEVGVWAGDDSEQFIQCCRNNGITALSPMILDGKMVGVIAFGKKATREAFTRSDAVFLESLSAIGAAAVGHALMIEALRESNRKLDARIQELNTLAEITREMNTTFDEQKILRILSYVLMGQFRATRFLVLFEEGGKMKPVLVKIPGFVDGAHLIEIGELQHSLIFQEGREPRGPMEYWFYDLGLRVVAPMLANNEVRGVVAVGERLGASAYESSEVDFLAALAGRTVSALENARLFRETLEKQRLEEDILIARNIQKGLLPAALPALAGFDFAAVNDSSQQVGGDYYDVIRLSEDERLIAIADVCGKGIPASLLMANVQAALRTLVTLGLPLPVMTMRLNTLIYENTAADKFITFFWGRLDKVSAAFDYVNAGHNPPYLVRADGAIETLDKGGMILGILPSVPEYESGSVQLHPGDVLVLYTDGVNEAMSADDDEFGEERLMAAIRNNRSCSAQEILDAIRSEVIAFTTGAKQSDDITMVVVKRPA